MNGGVYACLLFSALMFLIGTLGAVWVDVHPHVLKGVLMFFGFGMVSLWGAVVLHLAIDHKQQ